MTQLSDLENDYLDRKSQLQASKQNEAKKREEIAELKERKDSIQLELSQLNGKLSRAQTNMAFGQLSTDGYITLKKSIADKQIESEAMDEVLKIQANALQQLIENSNALDREMNSSLKKAAGAVKQRAIAAIRDEVGQHIETLAYATVAHHFGRVPSNGPDATEQINAVYQIIAKELCDEAFSNDKEALRFLINPFIAKEKVAQMIEAVA